MRRQIAPQCILPGGFLRDFSLQAVRFAVLCDGGNQNAFCPRTREGISPLRAARHRRPYQEVGGAVLPAAERVKVE